MRELNSVEVNAISGGRNILEAVGLTGDSSGYAATANVYGRAIAAGVGITFGIPGALAVGAAWSVGWGIGSLYNYYYN